MLSKFQKLLLISLLFPVLLYSQGINNLWLMGYDSQSGPPWGGIKMDFTGGTLNINQENRNINLECTNGLISDSIGNLLFVSNGIYIANAANDTMQNGSGLNPATFTTSHNQHGLTIPQANLVIPIPDHPNQYYLFHETCDDYGFTFSSFYLYYSVIDMSLNGGLGAVVTKNNVLLNDSLVAGRLTACKHSNGRDWWLILHQSLNTTVYLKFLITPYGIDGPYAQSIGSPRDYNFGQLVFSQDGNFCAFYEPTSDLDLFHFDRCTGDFTSLAHVSINDSAVGAGAAFSPNSKVLYLSSMRYVYQLDLTAADIAASIITVAIYDGYYSPIPPLATSFYMSQLASDGKIYLNCGNSTVDIHVINHPDVVGLGCDVCQHCIHLPFYNAFTIPNYPNYFLGSETGTVCDSLTNSISEFNSKINFQLNPNPVTGRKFTITYSALRAEGELQIINLEGIKVAGYPLPEWSSVQHLTLPELAPGIYMARLQSNGATGTIKFLVE